MSKKVTRNFIESDKEGYVLISKRTVIANSNAFKIACTQIGKLANANPEYVAMTISDTAKTHAEQMHPDDVEEIIKKAINHNKPGLQKIEKSPEESA